MTESAKNIVITVSESDNVGVVANLGGLPKDAEIPGGITLKEFVPMGHKIAITNLNEGDKIIRYGTVIGYANKTIAVGEWVNEHNMKMPEAPDLKSIPISDTKTIELEPLEGYTFLGYRNSDGSVGTKNILGISTSVQCVAGLAEHVERKVRNELLPFYPNVDDVVALIHTYGCGVAIEAPAAVVPIRTIRNIAQNPNFGGELMVLGLGCEKLRPEILVPKNENSEPDFSSVFMMQDESFNGFAEMVEGAMKLAKIQLEKLNQRKREVCPASELVVGMQCGGSDAFSGITCNPVVGFAADIIVRAGGSVMFSEVTEVRDGIQSLVSRAANSEVAKALIDEMLWYDEYLEKGGADRSANTTPGNKKGGLSNIVEKSLGP